MRPNPSRSNSEENGFWLMRISRIDSFGGRRPSLNPSIKICPPSGPADGPANAWSMLAISWESSGRPSISAPRSTSAPLLFSGSVLSVFSEPTVTSSFALVISSVMFSLVARAAAITMPSFSLAAKPRAVIRTVHFPTGRLEITKLPSLFVTTVFIPPLTSVTVTVAPTIKPPN